MANIQGEDPYLGGSQTAGVNKDKHVLVESVSKTDIEFQSFIKGRAYAISSTYSATANDEVISIKNDSTTLDFIVDEIVIGAGAACNFDLFEVTSGTPAGTTVTPINLNTGSGNSADLTCFGNASVTGSLSGSVLVYDGVTAASDHATLNLKSGLVIGQEKTIAVTASATTTVRITVLGYFRERI